MLVPFQQLLGNCSNIALFQVTFNLDTLKFKLNRFVVVHCLNDLSGHFKLLHIHVDLSIINIH